MNEIKWKSNRISLASNTMVEQKIDKVDLCLQWCINIKIRILSNNIYRSTPDYLIWLKYLSWFSYGNEMLVVNQWDDVTHISTYKIKHKVTYITCTTQSSNWILIVFETFSCWILFERNNVYAKLTSYWLIYSLCTSVFELLFISFYNIVSVPMCRRLLSNTSSWLAEFG